MHIDIQLNDKIEDSEILNIFDANGWAVAKRPTQLLSAMKNSHSLVTARTENRLVGIGNAISDGALVVYYSFILVHPDFQGYGIGKRMVKALQDKYQSFYQQILISEPNTIKFYESLGFKSTGDKKGMWIYQGTT